MIKAVKKIIRPITPRFVLNALKRGRQKKEMELWMTRGCPAPPPHIIKQLAIIEYQNIYKYTTFVETGTFWGEMVDAQKSKFIKVISIELGIELFEKAKERFKKDRNVLLLQGDSGKVLPEVLRDINEPAIFWLDGHYSSGITAKGDKDCPIYEELEAIFSNTSLNHVILIDDARCFIGEGDYPKIEELTEYIKDKNDRYQVEVKHDIIRYFI